MSRAPFVSPLFSVPRASELEREKETTAALISAFASEGYDTSVKKEFDGIEFVLSGDKGKKGGGGVPRPHTIDIDGDQWELNGPEVVPLLTDLSNFRASNKKQNITDAKT